ncbi:MAG: triphosphoribosyl-dephospho-CoA synthase [Oscillospiraceae bacterium]|nr:triphosphoribosyl-dephospho-CoA synthase [Oscillospiraceae bacterium]
MSSAAALWPYFEQCARLGRQTAGQPPEETFAALYVPGRMAEGAMLCATGGVNTHKGAVFTIGTLCAALGRLPRERWRTDVLTETAAMTRGLVERELAGLTEDNARTAGQKLYLHHRITGVRGQLEAGLPAVRNIGLPTLERGLSLGKDLNEAGCAALLAMIAAADDTNLIVRGGLQKQRAVTEQISELLRQEPYPSSRTLERLDTQFIEENLSPGGSADLLAACYLLHFLRTEIY